MSGSWYSLVGLIATGVEILGILTAIHAIMGARTSQGAIAWAVSLVTFPYIALPLYWVLSQSKFQGYVDARRVGDWDVHFIIQEAVAKARTEGLLAKMERPELRVFSSLAMMPFTHSNRVRLLVDGEATFDAIFEGIEKAKRYVLVQFFIVRNDNLGRELKARLIRKAAEGVRVYFLFDQIGSGWLGRAYIRELLQAGIVARPFLTTKGLRNRFQINFRNHRKIVVIDGETAYVGGLNVGDEYLGRSSRFGPWRDTHVMIEGPAVDAIQLSFVEDWYWATEETPELEWVLRPARGGRRDVLVLPTGPADDLETCGLFFLHMINLARERLWITSPYFVPDPPVMGALQLASLRGVDVRIMLPEKPDHLLVYLSSFSFLSEAEQADVKIYRYQPGFLHQKVILVDDHLAAVSTANLDNRSFRLNFELMALVDDQEFASEVQQMLQRDFEQCRRVHSDELARRSFLFKVAVRVARLMAPVQ